MKDRVQKADKERSLAIQPKVQSQSFNIDLKEALSEKKCMYITDG